MKIFTVLLLLLLSGCNLVHTLATTGTAATGSLVCGTIGGPVAGATCASLGVASVEVLAPAVTDKVTIETIGGKDGINTFAELLTYMYIEFKSHVIGIGIIVGLIWFLTGYFGLRIRRPEEKQLEKIIMEKLKNDK